MSIPISIGKIISLVISIGFLSSILSCFSESEIVVTPPNKVTGLAYVYEDPGNILKGESVSLMEINDDDTLSTTVIETEKTSDSGDFTMRYPRHMGPNPKYILKMDSATIGYMPLYAVASQSNIKINLFSTVVYELITTSKLVKIKDFTNEQLQALQNKAEELFNYKVANAYIQLDGLSIQSIYSALQNAIESSSEFMAMYDEFSKKIVSVEIPFGKSMRNESPQFLYRQPFNLRPNIYESNQMSFEINSADSNGDIMFYIWSIDGKKIQKGGYFFLYTPGYDTVGYGATNIVQNVTIEVSDGGYTQTFNWELTVFNKNRAPIISNIPKTAATEDILFTSTIEAIDQDGDYPLTITLQSGPTGLTLTQLTDRTASVEWTPTNCQVGNNNLVLNITDSQGLSKIQTLIIKVADPNLSPTFNPIACAMTATETVDWTCDINVTDMDMVPVASGGTLNDGCADIIGFSFLRSPATAKITKTGPNTAKITWRPKDNETGLVNFQIQVDDSHGAQVSKSFQVNTTNIDQRPIFFLNVVPGSYQANDIDNTDPYNGGYGNLPPAILNEDSVCPQLDITLNVYNGDLGERLTYRIVNPDPNPAPAYLVLRPTGEIFTTTTVGYWAYSSMNLTWCVRDTDTPNPAYPITVEVRDSNGNTDTYTMTFNLPERNQKPVITSIPASFIYVNYMDSICCDSAGANCNTVPNIASCPAAGSCFDQYGVVKGCWKDTQWTQPVQAIDPDAGDIVTCSINTTPAAAITINPVTCAMSWMPHWADMNIYTSIVTAVDNVAVNPPPGQGSTDSMASIFVQDVNYPPHITSTAPATGSDGSSYSYTVVATDPNITGLFRKLKYSLVNAPAGMSISTICPGAGALCTGLVTWAPTDAQAKTGSANFSVKVEDGGNPKLSHIQSNTVTLTDTNQTPTIDFIPTYYTGAGQTLNFLITGTDPDSGDSVTLNISSGAPAQNFAFTDQGGGIGSIVFSPTQTQIGSFDIVYRITDSHAASSTKTATIVVSDKPKIISIPPKQAKVGKEYTYTVRSIASQSANINYSVTIGPSGMSFQNNILRWTPAADQVGSKPVTIRIVNTDNNEYDDQTWSINTRTTNNNPVVAAQTPSCDSTIIATESKTFTISASGTDLDGDTLVYQWFIDDVWKTDDTPAAGSSVFNSIFSTSASGEHIVKLVITDGINPQELICNTHVRNATPVEGTSKVFTGRTISSAITNTETNKIILATKSGSNNYLTLIPDETKLSVSEDYGGCGGFQAQRLTMDNSHQDANNYSIYLAQNSDVSSGTNTFIRFFSIGSTCGVSSKDKLFYSGFQYTGGTHTAYNYINTNRIMTYHVNPSNNRYVRAYNSYNATYEPDIDMGANADITSVIPVTIGSSNLVFASDRFNNSVSVINSADNSIPTTVDLSSGCQNPFKMNYDSDTGEIYAYCGGNGVVSVIDTSDYSVTYITGFPTTITTDNPNDSFHVNISDNVVYVLSTQSKLSIWDLENDTIRILNLSKQYDSIIYNDTTNNLFLIDNETATITPIK